MEIEKHFEELEKYFSDMKFFTKLNKSEKELSLKIKTCQSDLSTAVVWYEKEEFPEYIQIGGLGLLGDKETRWGVYGVKTTKFSCEKVLVGVVHAFATMAEDYATKEMQRELQEEEGENGLHNIR